MRLRKSQSNSPIEGFEALAGKRRRMGRQITFLSTAHERHVPVIIVYRAAKLICVNYFTHAEKKENRRTRVGFVLARHSAPYNSRSRDQRHLAAIRVAVLS